MQFARVIMLLAMLSARFKQFNNLMLNWEGK